eukprot:TRINITY_DN4628_c0_g1_i1.p1 TRINITY_DN4628_c0_g1~~TRINITY_DN4628_c0_g1_i1.p1  ORF type:complete len:200 (-),score=56.47 TRINITY_DN4628_c0_g1_i1:75-674(-)
MKSIIFLSIVIAAYAWDQPWFCHDDECPEYQLITNNSYFELRKYQPAKWVSTSIVGPSYDAAVATGFWRLFNYISGENNESQQIPMTVPVRVCVQPDETSTDSVFTVSFFLPFEMQDNPPSPTNDQLYIEADEGMTVAVYSYPGFNSGSIMYMSATGLKIMLSEAKIQFEEPDSFVYAGYDAPNTIENRHNEVWIKVNM